MSINPAAPDVEIAVSVCIARPEGGETVELAFTADVESYLADPDEEIKGERMSNPWDRPPLPRRGDDSPETTYAAVGAVLSQWEAVESEVSHIYALCIGKMWEPEAYDLYYASGRTTRNRIKTAREAGELYFMRNPSQEAEGAFNQVMRKVEGFSERRHEAAHGIVRPAHWYRPLLAGTMDLPGSFVFCLVPPHYQRSWLEPTSRVMPQFVYSSIELHAIAGAIYQLLTEVIEFRHKYLPEPPTRHLVTVDDETR